MTPDQERELAARLERDAVILHARSRAARWRGVAVWLRFKALFFEETAVRLRRKAGP